MINDLNQYLMDHPQSESTRLVLQDGIQSSLTCPLRLNGKAVGVVIFSSNKLNTYQKSHVETFLNIADELSIIVEQEQLRNFFNANRHKERTQNMVLHDLHSPLSIIQLYLELSAKQKWFQDLSDEAKKVFTVLDRNTKLMSVLINELTEKNEMDREGLVLKKQNVVLPAFIEDVINRGRVFATKKEIDFISQVESMVSESIFMDQDRILQVLDNLFTNAIKYSKRHTQIIFRVYREQDRMVFSVKDQGQGIPEGEISKLFQEFGKTTTRPTEGESSTGLGLSIVKRIVEKHGGSISVVSEVGIGSTFTFWIPQAK